MKSFESTAKNLYENLYKNRNRMAHNTISYQYNIPTLLDLEKMNSDRITTLFGFMF